MKMNKLIGTRVGLDNDEELCNCNNELVHVFEIRIQYQMLRLIKY